MEESLQAEETLHAAPEQAVPEHGTEEQLQAQADAAAAQMAALPLDLATLALPQALDIPQLAGLEYAGVAVPGQPNLMPAITTLIMQITQHLSNPNGNPQLALTFQPLVNMALNLQLQASMTDMSAVNYLSTALAAGGGEGVAAAVQFDPQVLMAGATAAAAAAAGAGTAYVDQAALQQQQAQQQRQGGSGGRRRQRAEVGEEEEEEDDDWQRPWPQKPRPSGSGGPRPQRQRRKSKLLSEYLTDEEEH